MDKEENNNPESRKKILDAANDEIDKMIYYNLGLKHYIMVVISMWYTMIFSFLIPNSGYTDDENDNIAYLVAYMLLNILNVVMLVIEFHSICQRRISIIKYQGKIQMIILTIMVGHTFYKENDIF